MKEVQSSAPADEQKICVACGMCCDGTLFHFAHLNHGERGTLPEKIESNSYTRDGNDYFRLPCEYFVRKCKIYGSKRAHVCGDYRCQLLKDYAGGKVELEGALDVVREALNMRAEIMEQYRRISGDRRKIYFKRLLRELGKTEDSPVRAKLGSMEYDLLLAHCNIFEALLIKHFRSADDYEKMVMK